MDAPGPDRATNSLRSFRSHGSVAALLLGVAACQGAGDRSLEIAVLAPEDAAPGWHEPIDWALENVAAAGGPAGRRLRAVYLEPGDLGLEEAIRKALPSAGIVAAIAGGPSDETRRAADRLLAKEQVLVAYAATSGDLFRTYAGRRFFWRTVESDATQARFLVDLAVRGGARSAAFVTSTGEYGDDFFGWLGFFAVEQELPTSASVRIDAADPDCSDELEAALAGHPDVVIAAPANAAMAVCLRRELERRSAAARLLVSDAGWPRDGDAIAVEGLEGTSPAPDPGTGFGSAYAARFGRQPPQFAANAYDAVLLIAYGLARTGGRGGPPLADAIVELVAATEGEPADWTGAGIGRAFDGIARGQRPRISGASGPLRFDRDLQTDPVTTSYDHWQIRDGMPAILATETSREVDDEAAALAIERHGKRAPDDPSAPAPPEVGPLTSTWALIAATSVGWENYRHQAEALALYQLLRRNGVGDERIVLVLADDVAGDPANPEPGVVRLTPDGPDVRAGAVIDYPLASIDAEDLLLILDGDRSGALPEVIEGDQGANVLVYLAGHGAADGLHLGSSGASGGTSVLRPDVLSNALGVLSGSGRFRRALLAIESCQSGALGARVTAPRVAVLTASSENEASRATGWDPALGGWRADEFSLRLVEALEAPPATATELYLDLWKHVSGSHVQFYNVARWANPDLISPGEFVGADGS